MTKKRKSPTEWSNLGLNHNHSRVRNQFYVFEDLCKVFGAGVAFGKQHPKEEPSYGPSDEECEAFEKIAATIEPTE